MAESKVLNTAKAYADAVRGMMDAKAIFLYGSHAKGTATKDSDIDIAVVVDELPDDYLTVISQLWSLTRKVDHDIEPVLLTEADKQSGFLQTVERTGIAV